jgi:hypothetical protein
MKQYDPKEIAKWKAMIYGNIGRDDNKVDDWACADTSSAMTSPRKSPTKKKWGSSSPSSSSTPKSETSDWLTGESPTKAKKSYKAKGSLKAGTPF